MAPVPEDEALGVSRLSSGRHEVGSGDNAQGSNTPGSGQQEGEDQVLVQQKGGHKGQEETKDAQQKEQEQLLLKARRKQQRLLLLYHASTCPFGSSATFTGTTTSTGSTHRVLCTVSPHCAPMKALWSHLEQCSDITCPVAHCRSSRYVLRHYRKCRDASCLACPPIRRFIGQAAKRSIHTLFDPNQGPDSKKNSK